MKTNKKLKLNTKKVVILSNEQQASVQGGYVKIATTGFKSCRGDCD